MNGFLRPFGATGPPRAVGRIERCRAGLPGRPHIGVASEATIHGVRRQVEAALAAAAAERERSGAQDDDGPPRRGQAPVTDHVEIPNAGRTIQRLPGSGETWMTMKLQRNLWRSALLSLFFQPLQPGLGLGRAHSSARCRHSWCGFSPRFHRKHLHRLGGNLRLDLLHRLQRQFVQGDALFRGERRRCGR